jgi:hypothetical protein
VILELSKNSFDQTLKNQAFLRDPRSSWGMKGSLIYEKKQEWTLETLGFVFKKNGGLEIGSTWFSNSQRIPWRNRHERARSRYR